MKKIISILLAVLLAGLTVSALAETVGQDVLDFFEHEWADENDEFHRVDIWREDGKWYVYAMRFVGEDGILCVQFDDCTYDREQRTLFCRDGLLLNKGFMDEEDIEDGDVEASGFGAELTVDENGRLQWKGSGDAWEDAAYVNWDTEEDGVFTGTWEYNGGDVMIDIALRSGVYYVSVGQYPDDDTAYYWEYTCEKDGNKLIGRGTKTSQTLTVDEYNKSKAEYIFTDEDLELTEEEIYIDGEAIFTLEGNILVWDEAKENTGRGMRFVRIVEE